MEKGRRKNEKYKNELGGATLNKKAFTLIELLAVIVILAIIALIATPIILNIIEDARKESAERSVELYASAIKNAIAAKQMTGEEITDISQIDNMEDYYDGNVSCTTTDINTDGTIYLAGCTVNGTFLEDYTYGKQTKNSYENGEVVYFNVTTGLKCTEADYTANTDKLGKTGCMKFYAFNDDGGEKLNLLLDHNTTAMLAWNSSGSNTSGPNEVTIQLASDTKDWQGVETPSSYIDSKGFTVDYSGKTARLIELSELLEILGYETEEEYVTAIENFLTATENEEVMIGYMTNYCEENPTMCTDGAPNDENAFMLYVIPNYVNLLPNWAFDRTSTDCTNFGCLNNSDVSTYGYWTVSSNASNSSDAWRVGFDGGVNLDDVGNVGNDGVRPVITVLKSCKCQHQKLKKCHY